MCDALLTFCPQFDKGGAMKGLRLAAIQPAAIARKVYWQALADTADRLKLLAQSAPELDALRMRASPLFQSTCQLAEYARAGQPDCDAPALVRMLALFGFFSREEPETHLELVLAGALARYDLQHRHAITAAQLAIVAQLDRDHVLALATRDAIPGAYRASKSARAPWRFRCSPALQRWVQTRNDDLTRRQGDRHASHGTGGD
jgi:hypothetical protein